MAAERIWHVAIDTGGTFADAVGRDPQGGLHRAKILSSSALRGTVREAASGSRLRVETGLDLPSGFLAGCRFRLLDDAGRAPTDAPPVIIRRHGPGGLLHLEPPLRRAPLPGAPFEAASDEDAPILAARLLTRTPAGRPLPAMALRLATTIGTNALLTRSGARVALFITRGFADLPRIGTQQRPDLFDLAIRRPEPLHDAVVEVDERLAADGRVLRRLDEEALRHAAGRLRRRGFRVAAVALLHADVQPRHERRVEAILRAAGFTHVSCGAALGAFARLLPRVETAVVDAFLAPALRAHLDGVRRRLAGARLHVMTSAGGLVRGATMRPKDSLLSGPAGGVVGAALAARRSGARRAIAFDMGGTSTDVSRIDGDFEYQFEHRVGDAHVLAPSLAVESVAAGGGSICWFDGDRLRVGPRSASARPGPACYGGGGPLTLTDVNLLLGRLDARWFGIPIDLGAARAAFAALRGRVGGGRRAGDLLGGFLAIADERMADAIRDVSLRRGYDPAAYALVAFGGAGGQHACAVASHLAIRTIVVPRDAGLLSAAGLAHAVIERFAERQVAAPLRGAAGERRVRRELAGLARRAVAAVAEEGVPRRAIVVRRLIVEMRFAGQDSSVDFDLHPRRSVAASFARRYRALFGHRPERRPTEIVALRAVASSIPPSGERPPRVRATRAPAPVERRRAFLGGAWGDVPVFDRAALPRGAHFAGPALVFEPHGATCVESGWSARVDGAGALVLRRGRDARALPGRRRRAAAGRAAPHEVRLELFVNRFRSIALEMGERLRRTAVSTNIKERLDFSCGLLDPRGDLVVNAPHIPVHLGGLGLCVRGVARALRLRPGDVAATNHPAHGGSHLPDVTVVTPVHAGRRLLGYVASRAHHAEIGGRRPGSMPPDATRLVDEGVVIPPTLLLDRGRPRWRAVRALLAGRPFPSRAVEDNLADLRAAVAANRAGADALGRLARDAGPRTVLRFMRALTRLAEARLREALRRLPAARVTRSAEERLDDGTRLRVALRRKDGGARLDFTGTAPVHPGNLNATPAIVRSVVMYVLRLLVPGPLPLNEGLLRPVRLVLPRGLLHPHFPADPARAPAIVGGNVETSQRLADTLLKALRLSACSQGTMNNVLFGDARFGYYETVCGGAGAGPGFAGADAVHTHMTNTRITDVEIVERRYPVRIERFSIRRGSGGRGRWRGGDGARREYVFLAPLTLSLLAQHRIVPPYGMAGGRPGATGAQRLARAGAGTERLPGTVSVEVRPGDRLILETPGGGGWGRPGRGAPEPRRGPRASTGAADGRRTRSPDRDPRSWR